ncbi:CDP-glycerol glycerophosphotransferase family protein [Leucobacter sp. USHLN153]|uniref:CDP-glycerol glycerophosphotransferase family protein n=1 Tax=Leucobacter sp. USHLN153 TaxID=3081268 RepID=UPI0030182D18
MSAAPKSPMQAAFARFVTLATYAISVLASWFVPRRASRWVFGSWVGVGEGALAVARVLRASDPDAEIFWTVADDAEAELAEAEGFTAVRRSSWAGFVATLTAGNIVITHGYGDVNRFGIAGASITHLGHGVPLKRLHHHLARSTDGPGFAKSILRRIYRLGAERVQLYVTASVTVAERVRSANGVLPGRVQALGDPRDDIVAAQARDRTLAEAARLRVRELLELPADETASGRERLVLYAPTWRDGAADPVVPTPEEAMAISAWLAANGARLVIRSHPMGSGAYDAVFGTSQSDADDAAPVDLAGSRVHTLPASLAPDITPLLGAFDAVITDYSSIAIDFALLARPIVWFAPDLMEYSLSRGLYEPLEITSAGRIQRTWSESIERLDAVLAGGAATRQAEADARELAARFHDVPAGGAAARVLAEIRRLALPAAERVSEGVFFESFEGRQVSCNPLAIDGEIARRYPELPRYWSVTSERIEVPEGATPLLVGGSDWFAARKLARLLVVNDWLRFGFTRGRRQFVLQTWHGTMLKHLALTRPKTGLQTRIATRRESRRWSALLSQNPHSTEQFRASYAYRGEILETGYPRDDRLARATVPSPSGPERISILQAAARRTLSIPERARVLAYAPTWRETRRGAAAAPDLLDVADLAARLDTADDPWVVVTRGHTRVGALGGVGLPIGSGRIIDASHHPDVNDMLLAADLFVTDYSSTMFDAAVAAVPMAFYVPDLEDYRDRERGFTFDFEASAPGPLVRTADELIEVARAGVPYSEDYAAWRERFVPHDDGRAAERVVDALVERGALPSGSGT